MSQDDQPRFDNQPSELISARQAVALLGIKRATLYTYVSRGLIRALPCPRDSRQRRYFLADVERLCQRRDARAGHAAVAAGALRWGEPVIDTAISSFSSQGPVYRGVSAMQWVRDGASFEAVAEWLWQGHAVDLALSWPQAQADPAVISAVRSVQGEDESHIGVLSAAVTMAAMRDSGRFGAPEDAERIRARALIRHMTQWLTLASGEGDMRAAAAAPRCAEAVGHALGVGQSAEAAAAIERALVLCADHGLNASTFAARVAASTGADLYASVAAGLSALSGPRHGAHSERVEALLDEVGDPARAATVIRARLRRGEAIPGFGHPLYPEGDPRAAPLIEVARQMASGSSHLRLIDAVCDVMREAGYAPASLDVGLVSVCRALGLRRGGATALYAIGRSAGWIAHIFEQRRSAGLLRPRARFVGEREA